jgi:ubiquinone/menaquinone biosynthesis C-methylase UbiE
MKEDVYDNGTYDEKTDFAEKHLFSPMRQKLKELAGPITGNVLELAVSTGKGLSLYEGQDCRVIGADFSAPALKEATRKAAAKKIEFKPIEADVECLIDVTTESVDTVVCQLGFCTFYNPERVMNEVDRVLKPKGRILLLEHVVPDSVIMKLLLKLIGKKAKQEFGCNVDRQTLHMFGSRFTCYADTSKLGGFLHASVFYKDMYKQSGVEGIVW